MFTTARGSCCEGQPSIPCPKHQLLGSGDGDIWSPARWPGRPDHQSQLSPPKPHDLGVCPEMGMTSSVQKAEWLCYRRAHPGSQTDQTPLFRIPVGRGSGSRNRAGDRHAASRSLNGFQRCSVRSLRNSLRSEACCLETRDQPRPTLGRLRRSATSAAGRLGTPCVAGLRFLAAIGRRRNPIQTKACGQSRSLAGDRSLPRRPLLR